MTHSTHNFRHKQSMPSQQCQCTRGWWVHPSTTQAFIHALTTPTTHAVHPHTNKQHAKRAEKSTHSMQSWRYPQLQRSDFQTPAAEQQQQQTTRWQRRIKNENRGECCVSCTSWFHALQLLLYTPCTWSKALLPQHVRVPAASCTECGIHTAVRGTQ